MLKISKQQVEPLLPQERLYSLRSLRTPRAGKTLARWLMAIGTVFFFALFLPWQQNVRGTGAVTTLKPEHRPQTVETAIAGRIENWRVREGMRVKKGDTLITLSEINEKFFDPALLTRLSEQIIAKENSLLSKQEKAQALQRQIKALRNEMEVKTQQAKAKLEAETIRFQNAENQYQRNKTLFEAGNIPLTKFQDIEYKWQGSKADFNNAKFELDRVELEFLDKINKAESDRNNTESEIFESRAEIAKLKNEYANMQIRNRQYQVVAPQAGIVVKALKAGIGETIKSGDAVCTIMPESGDIAVEMYVRAMDVPLISRGRHVRIQFDGWPALQFSGWPSVSVGTFGGRVEVIDYVNSKPGEFRILVVPDPNDEPWPPQLRMGSGTKGWVMLDNVRLWYEIWRQLNGFPASLYGQPTIEEEEESKTTNGADDGKK